MKVAKVLALVASVGANGFLFASDLDFSLMGNYAGNVNCELGVQIASTAKTLSPSDNPSENEETSCHLLVMVQFVTESNSIEMYYRLGNAPDLPPRPAIVPVISKFGGSRTKLKVVKQGKDFMDLSMTIYDNDRKNENEVVAKRFVSILRNENGEKILQIFASQDQPGMSVDIGELKTNGPVPESGTIN